jgi:hypothetical protein
MNADLFGVGVKAVLVACSGLLCVPQHQEDPICAPPPVGVH